MSDLSESNPEEAHDSEGLVGEGAPQDPAVAEKMRMDWQTAVDLLGHMLQRSDGCVSSLALGRELGRKGIADTRQLVVKLKYFDFDAPADPLKPAPSFRWHHHGRSFFTEEGFKRALSETESEADSAAAATPVEAPETSEPEAPGAAARRPNRQEEARLVRFVVDALADVYASDCAPDDVEISFDVHNERAGTEYENVDVIAIHWRSAEIVDIASVEVKLEFSARAVQQAHNYTRFSDRVWIAVPVQAPVGQAAIELRETDPRLFEYVIREGIGILACHRRRGRSYDVVPVHWPRRWNPDPADREALIERHRSTFEEAGVVEPRARARFPRLR